MQRPSKVSAVFLTVWATLALVTGRLIVRQMAPSDDLLSTAIAQLEAHSGQVDARHKDNLLWDNAQNGRGFSEGDLVATGKSSSALIRLNDGRALALGDDTQISISSDLHDDQGAFAVTLIRGSIDVKPKPMPLPREPSAAGKAAPMRHLIVKVGRKAVHLDLEQDSVDIVKAPGKPAEIHPQTESVKIVETNPAAPSPAAPAQPQAPKVDEAADVAALAVQNVPLVTPTPLPSSTPLPEAAPLIIPVKPTTVEAKAAPKPSPTRLPPGPEFAPTVALSGQPVHWSTSYLEASLFDLPLSVPKAARRTNIASWQPFVTAHSGGDHPTIAQGTDSTKAQTISLPLRPLMLGKAGKGRLALKVTPSAHVKPTGGVMVDVKGKEQTFHLVSLPGFAAGLRGKATTVFLPKSPRPKNQRGWFIQDHELSAADASLAIKLQNGADLVSLAPLLIGSDAFAVTEGHTSLPGAEGVYGLGRRGVLVAEISMRGSDPTRQANAARFVANLLSADLIFRGKASALVYSAGSKGDLSDLLKSMHLAPGEYFYFFDGRRLYHVDPNFMASEEALQKFVTMESRAVFNKKVEIISLKGMVAH